jgi:hypothetical protein
VNTLIRKRILRRMTAALLVATLAVRALLPIGYMPGNVFAGEIAELCPVASAATFSLLGSSAGHDHHHGDDADSISVSTACPIGSSLFFDALPTLPAPEQLQKFEPVQQHAVGSRPKPAVVAAAHRARAPPLS